MGQLSFYSADARPRAVTDLEGLLCAGARLSVFGRGTTAKLGIVLGAPPPPQPAPEEDDTPLPVADTPVVRRGARPWRRAPAPARRERPAVDPEDLAHLDLDPDEIEAYLRGAEEDPDGDDAQNAGGPGVDEAEAVEADEVPDDATPPEPEPEPEPWRPDPVDRWRAHAIACALRSRGVDAEVGSLADGRAIVCSSFRADLATIAALWAGDDPATKQVPDDFELDGPRLRLWVLAAGRVRGRAYTLGLDPDAVGTHEALLTASRRAGLGATLAGEPGAPELRIVGARRHRRLGELVGDRPRDLPDGLWPV